MPIRCPQWQGDRCAVAVCAGALRQYLLGLDPLPEESLVAMVAVGVNAEQS